ncbi:hypothetical protein BRC83_04775 [Halobacteriales archaeon QS_1_68_17]|nr:MAG: hypothetical protein BRC83_04775 [Halobacteriales archaeon QS_1_68_17]
MDTETGDASPAPETWLDAIDEMLDEGVDSDEAVTLTAEELTVDVPMAFGADAPRATWRFDGSVTVSVDGMRRPLAGWLRLWARGPRSDDESP